MRFVNILPVYLSLLLILYEGAYFTFSEAFWTKALSWDVQTSDADASGLTFSVAILKGIVYPWAEVSACATERLDNLAPDGKW